MFKNIIYINLFVFLVFLSTIYLNVEGKIISFIFCDLYALIFYLRMKVKLKFTKRILRLIVASTLAFFLLYKTLYFSLIGLEYIIIVVFFLMRYIENLISKYYLIKCKEHLQAFSGTKIAITGSFGKTSTKNFIYSIISKSYSTLVMPKSYNTIGGICKVINSTNLERYEYIIFEMGASHVNDIKNLMALIDPDISILTSIGNMHLNTFKTLDNIIEEKCKAVNLNKGISIVNCYNEYIRDYNFLKKPIEIGKDKLFSVRNINIRNKTFDLYLADTLFDKYKVNVSGIFNYYNIALSIVVSYILGINKNDILNRVYEIKNIENRLSIKKYPNLIVIDDSFNSNLLGAKEALRLLLRYRDYKIILTPLFVEIDSININDYLDMLKKVDLVILVGYHETIKAYNYLNISKAIIVDSYKEGMKIIKKIVLQKKVDLLIENDLPDVYKKGF